MIIYIIIAIILFLYVAIKSLYDEGVLWDALRLCLLWGIIGIIYIVEKSINFYAKNISVNYCLAYILTMILKPCFKPSRRDVLRVYFMCKYQKKGITRIYDNKINRAINYWEHRV